VRASYLKNNQKQKQKKDEKNSRDGWQWWLHNKTNVLNIAKVCEVLHSNSSQMFCLAITFHIKIHENFKELLFMWPCPLIFAVSHVHKAELKVSEILILK
jgi:hypothetical protein